MRQPEVQVPAPAAPTPSSASSVESLERHASDSLLKCLEFQKWSEQIFVECRGSIGNQEEEIMRRAQARRSSLQAMSRQCRAGSSSSTTLQLVPCRATSTRTAPPRRAPLDLILIGLRSLTHQVHWLQRRPRMPTRTSCRLYLFLLWRRRSPSTCARFSPSKR